MSEPLLSPIPSPRASVPRRPGLRRTRETGWGHRAVGWVALALLVLPAATAAQVAIPGAVRNQAEQRLASVVSPVPFGPGELATYQVKFGFLSVGEGSMQVTGVDRVRGNDTYHIDWAIRGGIPGARVNDRWQSWLDVADLYSHRYVTDISEVRYRANRHWEFFPLDGQWRREDNGETGDLASDLPLDDVAFVYYVRTLPLEVGDVYTLPRYFRESGNPVIVRVLRKDRVEVPAGTFNTVVVQPVIRTRGLFSEGGRAEIHFTDDHRRILVYLQSKVSFGNLSLHLRTIEEGRPLRPLNLVELTPPPGTTRAPTGGS